MYSETVQMWSVRRIAIAGVRPDSEPWTQTQLSRSRNNHSAHCNVAVHGVYGEYCVELCSVEQCSVV